MHGSGVPIPRSPDPGNRSNSLIIAPRHARSDAQRKTFGSRFAQRTIPILFALVAVPVLPPAADTACAQEPARAGIVIRFDAGRETSECADISEAAPDGVSGLEALTATGLAVVTKDFGGDLGQAVCKIEDVGTDDCNFNAGFWGYFRGSDGAWTFSEVGPSSSRVESGGVEGWVWTAAGAGDATPPGATPDFDRICAQEATPVGERQEPGGSILPWAIAAAAVAILGALLIRRRGA
jgi:hypothetical protein